MQSVACSGKHRMRLHIRNDKIKTHQPAAAAHFTIRFERGTRHAFGSLEQVHHVIRAPVCCPDVAASHLGPRAAQRAHTTQWPAPLQPMQLRLRVRSAQSLQTIAHAASCIQNPCALIQMCMLRQRIQCTSGCGKNRCIAPSIERVNQEQQGQRHQPSPRRQTDHASSSQGKRKAQRNHATPPPILAEQAGRRTDSAACPQSQPDRQQLGQQYKYAPCRRP